MKRDDSFNTLPTFCIASRCHCLPLNLSENMWWCILFEVSYNMHNSLQ